VYDITVADSLTALDYFNDLIEMENDERRSGVQHVKIVAGNKCDLAESRAVTSTQGLNWARDHGCGFMETSAKNVVNVEETFQRGYCLNPVQGKIGVLIRRIFLLV
jgi:GTPase KRas protein